ncbi:MAG: GNAT family N-acetyltransferase [Reyranellaceae bacterium]
MIRQDWRTATLTSAGSDDAAALYRLFFPQPWERPWSSGEFGALLATPGCFGHLLMEAGRDRAVGLILLRAAADEAEIITIGVVPDRRRRGGAARLLRQAMAECAARGVCTLFLDVAADNEPARRFYERHGFATVGTRASYYTRGPAAPVDALVMKRTISHK